MGHLVRCRGVLGRKSGVLNPFRRSSCIRRKSAAGATFIIIMAAPSFFSRNNLYLPEYLLGLWLNSSRFRRLNAFRRFIIVYAFDRM